MVLTLGMITLIGSAAVGLVYGVTKEPIAAAKRAKTLKALEAVLPGFEGDPKVDSLTVDGKPAIVYSASKEGHVVGYAVESLSTRGFNGAVKLMTGFDPAGEILNIVVLLQTETPGLGDKMEKTDFLSAQFKGKNPADLKMVVRKDGGDIDALTASTISSRAYADAVQHAWDAMQTVRGETPADGNTGATTQKDGGSSHE